MEYKGPKEYQAALADKARSDKKTIVLPEPDDLRVLEAASILLKDGIVNLILLGDEATVKADADKAGFDISQATIISPHDEQLVEKFAKEFYELRKHKGVSMEDARETVQDVSYFGTMMIHTGQADGMVSGAAHTTAHTIRPALQVIKTQKDVSVVSGAFLMLFDDVAHVYADCAVTIDPDAKQLADIAVSSSKTATAFGIDPKVALISYSTGTSGSGPSVDKVTEATNIAKDRAPEVAIDGPLQFDAAFDPTVGEKKMPGSPVAGKATVFVFPNLDTGNCTYKAVQRTSGAVAVGPILQGLNKPVNDLSRGALVEDIVNTVIITALQAQN